MKNYSSVIEEIKRQLNLPENEIFKVAPSGTHYQVFVSEKYVIRFHENNQELLIRESNLLQNLNHPLIPKVIHVGEAGSEKFMVENRLPGDTINLVWKDLTPNQKQNVVEQIVEFLKWQRTQTKEQSYSVTTGKVYDSYIDFLTDGVKDKVMDIGRHKQATQILEQLLVTINNPKLREAFSDCQNTLVHGDLIIHNLLTDKENLTGVLDWELALYGDPDHDIFRLYYYQECAQAYQEQGIDDSFEADYMNILISEIEKTNLIQDKEAFQTKYRLARAAFYLKSLHWAATSDSPAENLQEIIDEWNKKRD